MHLWLQYLKICHEWFFEALPVDTKRKSNVLGTFNLHPVSTGSLGDVKNILIQLSMKVAFG